MTFTTTTNATHSNGNTPDRHELQPISKTPVSIFAPFNYLTNMRLVLDVEQAIAGNQSIIALGIKRALYDQTPAVYILKEIREMAEDNRMVMEDMLGVLLTDKIMKS